MLTRALRLSGLCLAVFLGSCAGLPVDSDDLREADALNRQVEQLHKQGRIAEAIPLAQKMLAIYEKILGPDDPKVARSLNNLAFLYMATGAFTKVEPLLTRALVIEEKALGPEHREVATSLDNLARLYWVTGAHDKVEPLLTRALAIRESTLGPTHAAVAQSANNLAMFHMTTGAHTKAEPLFTRALAIAEKALGPEHPDVATCLSNLAGLYWSTRAYAKVEPLLARALAIREKALRPQHPELANSLNNLAEVYRRLGDYPKAEPLYRRALAILEETLGPEHPNVAICLNNLAGLSAEHGDFAQALRFATRAQEIDNRLIEEVFGAFPEERKAQFLITKDSRLQDFLSLIAQHFAQDNAALRVALDHWLVRKGALLEAQKRFQEALALADDPAILQAVQALARVRAQLSQLAFTGPGKEGPAAHRARRETLLKEKDALEEQLVKLSQAYAVSKRVRQADAAQVAHNLPRGTVLLDFAKVTPFDFQAKGEAPKRQPARYLAFVLPAGGADRIQLVDLGEAAAIEQAVEALRKEISAGQDLRGVQIARLAQETHARVFAPLRAALGPARELFISPDAFLSLIPFEILQTPEGKFLIEEYLFNYLAASRDLLAFKTTLGQPGKPLLLGDPDFDLSPGEKAGTLRQLAMAQLPARVAPNTRSAEMQNLTFTRLPGSGREVRAIQALLGKERADLYTGKEALEEVLRQRKAPRILHLATHGFFLSDQDLGPLPDDPDRGADLQPPGSKARASAATRPLEDPFLRSGFALAGANQALQANDTDRSDGIVTAEKVLGLPLHGTELVVLSACETGVGTVKNGEGVYGLRRAFTLAGAKSLVMSMWSVPDRETQELMVQFYTNMQSGTMSRAQALRQAALSQMQIVKARYGEAHPFFWGAFLFLGEP
jgi:CHAT domain-containing protein/tetratricopeptide (TPR) repeat protein